MVVLVCHRKRSVTVAVALAYFKYPLAKLKGCDYAAAVAHETGDIRTAV